MERLLRRVIRQLIAGAPKKLPAPPVLDRRGDHLLSLLQRLTAGRASEAHAGKLSRQGAIAGALVGAGFDADCGGCGR